MRESETSLSAKKNSNTNHGDTHLLCIVTLKSIFFCKLAKRTVDTDVPCQMRFLLSRVCFHQQTHLIFFPQVTEDFQQRLSFPTELGPPGGAQQVGGVSSKHLSLLTRRETETGRGRVRGRDRERECVCVYVYVYIYTRACVYTCMCVYMGACMYMRVYVHIWVCVCMYMCVYICVCVWQGG